MTKTESMIRAFMTTRKNCIFTYNKESDKFKCFMYIEFNRSSPNAMLTVRKDSALKIIENFKNDTNYEFTYLHGINTDMYCFDKKLVVLKTE